MKIILNIIILFIIFSLGAQSGFIQAHKEVAKECHTLGGFYVGDETFSCSLKK